MGILSTTTLEYTERSQEAGDVAVFTFTAARPFRHIAGQHGLFTIKGAGMRAFSLASAPDDEAVVIGTRLRPGSAFKQALAALQPGDRIAMRGPILRFTLDGAGSDVVFLAQGVGITPFRSLLRHIALRQVPVQTTLVHVANGHTFHEETHRLADEARYPHSREDFAVDVKQVAGERPAATYFLSGTPDFIATTTRSLKDMGVVGKKIRKDPFRGY